MKKIFSALITLTMALSVLTGCQSNPSKPADDSNTQSKVEVSDNEGTDDVLKALSPRTVDGPVKIGLIPITMNTQYTMVINGAKEAIERNGGSDFAELIVQAPAGNASSIQEQSDIFANFLQQDLDVIVLSTESDEAMLPYIEQANQKNIPIVLFNFAEIKTPDDLYITHCGFDNYEACKGMGEWVAKQFGDEETEVAIIEGFPGVINTERIEGFKAGFADKPNIKVVASQPADWNREKGQSVAENMLTANPNIDMIWGAYDEMALGAVAAVKQQGLLGSIKIGGFDNTRDAYDSIKAGEMSATVDSAAKEMGTNIVAAIKSFCVDGEEIPHEYKSTCLVLDNDNIDEYDLENYEYVPRQVGE